MKDNSHNFDGFIGIFDNLITQDNCNRIIEHFELVHANDLTLNRQKLNSEIKQTQKDTTNYFLSGTSSFANNDVNNLISSTDIWIFDEFKKAVWQCYTSYCEKYGILDSLGRHAISGSIKIQKSIPGQGYHMWHCESDCLKTSNRIALIVVYLNDVDHGGETEYLYQSLRIIPKVGRITISPADYTHTHRGNPPLKNSKYIMTTWIEFIE